MDTGILIAIISLVTPIIVVIVTWLVNRRKNVGEYFNTVAESAQTSVETMQATMTTLHAELKEAQEKLSQLNTHVQELTIEILKLKAELAESEREKIKLKERIYMLTASLQAQAVERNEYI